MLVYYQEGIDGVAEALRHLVAVLVEHQPVGYDIFKRNRIRDHRGDGVQREEPSACLVNPLSDEISREHFIKVLPVFKRIVCLCIGHRSRVKPYVYQVRLTLHGPAGRAYQHNIIHIRPVQVEQ